MKNIVKSFKVTFLDFLDGVKKYTKTFVILLILFASFLAYSGINYSFNPQSVFFKYIVKTSDHSLMVTGIY